MKKSTPELPKQRNYHGFNEQAFMLSWEEIVIRIVLGALLGGLVGMEREFRGQAAGFRTHTLVAMGATLVTLVSQYGFTDFINGDSTVIRFDPSRIAAQIVVGVGFLGAGAIMRHGTSVKGITTAASLWVVAAMGLAVGTGYYVGAVTVSLLLLIILRGLRPLEYRIVRWARPEEATLIVRVKRGITNSHVVTSRLEDMDIQVVDVDVESGAEDTVLHLEIVLPRQATAEQAVQNISEIGGVLSAEWQR